MALQPQYIGIPKNGVAQVSTANTTLTGAGTLVTVYTAGATGSRIDSLLVQATGTTTAGMVRLFISDGTTNHRLIMELPVVAITPAATLPAWSATVNFPKGLVLQATWLLKASTHNAETFNIIPTVAGDF